MFTRGEDREPTPEEVDQHPALVDAWQQSEYLRWPHGIGVGVLCILILVPAPIWAMPVLEFSEQHWAWIVLIPLGFALWWVGLEFFEAEFFWTCCAVAMTLGTALQVDGIVDVVGILRTEIGGFRLWFFLAIIFASGLMAWGVTHIHESEIVVVLIGIAGVTWVALVLYIAWNAAIARVELTDFRMLLSGLRQHWAPVGLVFAAAVTFIRLRSGLNAMNLGRYDDGWDYLPPPQPLRGEEVGGPDQGRWARKMVEVLRRSGIGIFDGTLILLTASLFALTVLYYVPDQLVANSNLTAADAATARTNERRTVLALLASIGAAITLVYTHLRHQLDRESASNARFADGVAQLATETLSTRLGGLYALAQIARESPRDANNVVQILAAYAQESTRVRAEAPEETPLTQVTTAALAVLSETPSTAMGPNLRGLILSQLVMDETLRFRPWTDLQDSDFRGSTLTRGVLRRVSLVRAKLQESHWLDSDLSDSDMRLADCSHATFRDSVLRNTSFSDSNCEWSRFRNVTFDGATFDGSSLRGAQFVDCSFRGASFFRCDLRGADLSSSDLSEVNFIDVGFDAGTRWPRGFDPSSIGRTRRRPRQ
ncbi:hypothetical protein GCM10009719_26090 [Nocardioides kribbensis]